MDVHQVVSTILIAAGGAVLFFSLGYWMRRSYAERLIRTAESKARELLTGAKRESEQLLKHADRDAKTLAARLQSEFENKIAETKRSLDNAEKILKHQENTIAEKLDAAEKKEK